MKSETRIPTSTYRLQLNRAFPFLKATEVVDYLAELGVGAVYSSPFFRAHEESTHGYDIADHREINPALGGAAAFERFTDRLRERGLMHVADFVPNHMGIGEASNTWWMDVLENGPSSVYAKYFDIDWDPLKDELQDKVLLPILGDQYGRVLERGELRLAMVDGSFVVQYWEHQLPVNPRTYPRILEGAMEGLDDSQLDAPEWIELRSIVTACSYLPPRTETDPERIAERAREKEVIKRRLERLAGDASAVAAAIDRTLEELNGRVGHPRSFDRLDQFLNEQAYRLSFWRVAAEEINYRRFFDINELAALRMEEPEVFDATHALLVDLVREGRITGLRIDHPDGLYDPKGYFDRVQEQVEVALQRAGDKRPIWMVAEKILSHREYLPRDWRVHGTTGYDFLNQMTRVMIDPGLKRVWNELYLKFIDSRLRFSDLVYEKKQLVMRLSLANDVNVLAYLLNQLSERNRYYRDYTLNALRTAVREVVACFPVYRTYLVPGEPVPPDSRRMIMSAVAQARRRNPAIEGSIFEFVGDILQFRLPENVDEDAVQAHYDFVMRFQQISAPIMAKGVEDTAFYIYNRQLAVNEVGGEPDHFGSEPVEFHEEQSRRLEDWPHAMTSLSTHDTKRSEDVRARLIALAEWPVEWRKGLRRWSGLNDRKRHEVEGELAPTRNEEYLLYQTLLGTWPLEEMDADAHGKYVERIRQYMQKAMKEAKENTSWIQPNEAWDKAVADFVGQVLRRGKRNAFVNAFAPFAEEVARYGAIYSLAQKVVQMMVPGVPDLYQGTELWDFSLVDPDNRRPVDYGVRRQMLRHFQQEGFGDFEENWRSGLPKLGVVHRLLVLRRESPEVFGEGAYHPLEGVGSHGGSLLAFAREWEGQVIVVAVPRLARSVGWPCLGDAWGAAAVELPPHWRERCWESVLDPGAIIEPLSKLPAALLFERLPVAVWRAV